MVGTFYGDFFQHQALGINQKLSMRFFFQTFSCHDVCIRLYHTGLTLMLVKYESMQKIN